MTARVPLCWRLATSSQSLCFGRTVVLVVVLGHGAGVTIPDRLAVGGDPSWRRLVDTADWASCGWAATTTYELLVRGVAGDSLLGHHRAVREPRHTQHGRRSSGRKTLGVLLWRRRRRGRRRAMLFVAVVRRGGLSRRRHRCHAAWAWTAGVDGRRIQGGWSRATRRLLTGRAGCACLRAIRRTPHRSTCLACGSRGALRGCIGVATYCGIRRRLWCGTCVCCCANTVWRCRSRQRRGRRFQAPIRDRCNGSVGGGGTVLQRQQRVYQPLGVWHQPWAPRQPTHPHAGVLDPHRALAHGERGVGDGTVGGVRRQRGQHERLAVVHQQRPQLLRKLRAVSMCHLPPRHVSDLAAAGEVR